MKRSLVLGTTILFMASTGLMTAFGAGWSSDSGEWRYLDQDGRAVTEQWRKSNEGWYYLDSDGTMVKNELLEIDSDRYYVDSEGRMVQNRWMAFDADESTALEYGIDQCWYYFGTDGKAYYRKGDSFKKKIEGTTYIFDEDGVMLTGFFDEDGNWIDHNDDPFVDARYYSGADGAMYANQWLEYDYRGGSDLESEMASEDYSNYDSLWLYFDSNGKKVKSGSTDHLTQRNLADKTYAFDENGVMLPWWNEVASGSNASAKYFSGYDGGQLLKDTWVWMYPSEKLAEQAEINQSDYADQECSWWRTDENGQVYKNKIKNLGGKSYAFDEIGRMQTGFVLFDGKSEFVTQYDVDAWSSDEFIYGETWEAMALEKADLYLFAPDELNDGSMQTGDNIQVELEDGTYTFGFDKNGKAYGNRNQLAKKSNRYYINGLRLEADKDMKYGVVEVKAGQYKVVNTAGKIVDGKKKVVKDQDGGWLIIINDEFKAYVGDSDSPRWYNGPDGEGYYHYDKDTKYGDFITNGQTAASTADLPEEEMLNFD